MHDAIGAARVLALDYRPGVFLVHLRHERDPADVGGVPREGADVVPRDVLEREVPRPRHQLADALSEALVICVHADRAGVQVLEVVAVGVLEVDAGDEDLVHSGPEALDVDRQISFEDTVADGLADHRSRKHASRHPDRLDVRRPERDSLHYLVFKGDTSRKDHRGYILALLCEVVDVLISQAAQLDGRYTPLVHHAPRAHACAAAGTIDREHVYPVVGRVPDRPREVHRAIGAGLEEHPLGTKVSHALDAFGKPFLGDHAQARVALEVLHSADLERLDDLRVIRVRQDDVALALHLTRLLYGLQPDLAADVLGALAPFQLNGLDAQVLEDVPRHAEVRVLHVELHDDVPVPFQLPVAVRLYPVLHVGRLRDLAVLDAGSVVSPADVLAYLQDGPRYRASDRERVPVPLCHVGGTEPRHHERQAQLDRVLVADGGLDVHSGEHGVLAVGRNAMGPHGRTHDVEVGEVNGVLLLRSRRHHAERLRIDALGAAYRGLPDLTHADASLHASGAHAAERAYAVRRAVLRQCRRRPVYLCNRHSCQSSLSSPWTGTGPGVPNRDTRCTARPAPGSPGKGVRLPGTRRGMRRTRGTLPASCGRASRPRARRRGGRTRSRHPSSARRRCERTGRTGCSAGPHL